MTLHTLITDERLLRATHGNPVGQFASHVMATEPPRLALDAYDAGLLNDYGGGDVGWWWDYIRSELERAHEHYVTQVENFQQSRNRHDQP